MAAKFFSVSVDCLVNGTRRVPGVCYSLTQSIAPFIEVMAEQGAASLFEEEVRIVTGVPYSLGKPPRMVEKLPVQRVSVSTPSAGAKPVPAASQTAYDGLSGYKGTLTRYEEK